MFLRCIDEFMLSFFSLCSVLVYHGFTNANIGPWKVGDRLKHLPPPPNTQNNSFCKLLLLLYSTWIFYISVSWWSFTGVWVTASLSHLQDSSQYSGRSQQCHNLNGLASPSDFQLIKTSFQSLWGPFQMHQFQMESTSPSNSITFIIIFILIIWEFFAPASTDGFLQDVLWQQVFSNLQDSSQYSSRS